MAQDHIDTHPGIAEVDFQEGSFASQLLAVKVSFVALFRLISGLCARGGDREDGRR